MKQEVLEKQLAELEKGLAAAKESQGKTDLALKAAKEKQAELAQTGSEGAKQEAQKSVDNLTADVALGKKLVLQIEQSVALTRYKIALPKRSGCPAVEYKFELRLEPPQPDPSSQFVAELCHSPLRDDEVTVETSPSGLLTSSNVISADRTAEIIIQIAKAIATLQGGLPGYQTAAADLGEQACPDTDPVTLQELFDPSNPTEVERVSGVLAGQMPFFIKIAPVGGSSPTVSIPSEVKGLAYRRPIPYVATIYEGQSRSLVGSLLEIHRTARQADHELERAAADMSKANRPPAGCDARCAEDAREQSRAARSSSLSLLGNAASGLNATIASLPDLSAKLTEAMTAVSTIANDQSNALEQINKSRNALRLFSEAADSLARPVQAAALLLPNRGPIAYVPIRSTAFARTTSEATFVDGMLTKSKTIRPSEFAEVVRLPAAVARELMTVPTELLQLRVDQTGKENALLEAEQAQLRASEALRATRECVTAAIQQDAPTAGCFPD